MASVTIQNVEKTFGSLKVIHGVNIEVREHEFVVLVGPSGCGKSTLLRMIAGLETISAGEITIGKKVVNNVPPRDRDIAMVFQNYALYPHMSIYDNMGFSLKLRKRPKAEIEQKVKGAAEILNLIPYLSVSRASFRADSANAWQWGARWSEMHRCSCSTSHCRTWMRSCASACEPRSRRCISGSRQPRST